MTSFNELLQELKQIHVDRDWGQFHKPKDLLIALTSEVGELADCYRWLNEEEMSRVHTDPTKKEKIASEMADILAFLMTLAYRTDVDLLQSLKEKLEKVKRKYPVEKSKGVHSNVIEGFKPRS